MTICDSPAVFSAEHQNQLQEIAASIGSDVPFFFGGDTMPAGKSTMQKETSFGRATGRGEKIQMLPVAMELDLVVVYPPVALSTARVYAESILPESPLHAENLIEAIQFGNLAKIAASMHNRLSEPAAKIVTRIDEILRLMWQSGLKGVQLTGSGSACFGIADSSEAAKVAATAIRNKIYSPENIYSSSNADQMGSGALIFQTQTTSIPTEILLH